MNRLIARILMNRLIARIICGYLHRKCSGLRPNEQWYENFICVSCPQITPLIPGLSEAFSNLAINVHPDRPPDSRILLKQIIECRPRILKCVPKSSRRQFRALMTSCFRDIVDHCAILPDWHSATFRRDRKRRLKALVTKKVLRRRVEIFRKFKFFKFRLTGKYFSEIQKDGHFDEKQRKNRKTTNIVKNSRTRKREKRSLLSWQSHTIRPIAERNSEKEASVGKEYSAEPSRATN